MVSFDKKFILITPEKTGSVSITEALFDYVDIKKINKQRFNKDGGLECFDFDDYFRDNSKHTRLRFYSKNWQKEFGELSEFTIGISIRNPFERVLSWWKWRGAVNKFSKFCKNHNPSLLTDYAFCENAKATEFIRFENLQEDFDSFCEKIGVPKSKLPHRNKSNHEHYSSYYDKETRDIIETKYKKDLDAFNYKFEHQI